MTNEKLKARYPIQALNLEMLRDKESEGVSGSGFMNYDGIENSYMNQHGHTHMQRNFINDVVGQGCTGYGLGKQPSFIRKI